LSKLIIFDCDGVLVDSEIIANRIDAETLTSFGYPISTEESIKKFVGMSAKAVNELILKESGISLPSDLWTLTEEHILKAFEAELLPLMLPVLENPFLKNVKKCVASSSTRKWVLRSLQMTKQDHFFQNEHVFTASQVKHGKPAPDVFLFAAEQMGYSPKDCLVIEDSIVGIEAARAAKMDVIGFLGGRHAQFEWYKERIRNEQVVVVEHVLDLLSLILDTVETYPVQKEFNVDM